MGDNDRLTEFGYDDRDRRNRTTNYIVRGETPVAVVTLLTLDNNGQTTSIQQYNTVADGAHRIAQTDIYIDNLGRRYHTDVWGVTIPGGTKSDYALFGNTWYYATNQPAKQSAPGASQAYAKMTYDLANRTTGTYIGFAVDDGEKAWTIGDSDKIFEQTILTLDDPGHVLQTAGYQRNQDATGTNVLTADNARVSYAGAWFDGTGRAIAGADYGTNSFDPAEVLSPPESSDSVLVSLTGYNARGEAFETIDPAGTVNRTLADDTGRQVCMIGNFVAEGLGAAGEGLGCAPGVPLASEVTGYGPVSRPCHDPCANPTAGTDVNVTTLTSYTPDGNIATLTAKNPVTGDQATRYLYGTTLGTGGTGRAPLPAAICSSRSSIPTRPIRATPSASPTIGRAR